MAVDEYVSACWLCGGAIYPDRGMWIDRRRFEEEIAGGSVAFPPDDRMRRTHHELVRDTKERGGPTTGATEYYDFVAEWLALPDAPVDVCQGCKDVLRDVRERNIDPVEIPVPFLFREAEGRGRGATNWIEHEMRPPPRASYAAQAAAIYWAESLGFQLRDGKDGFWWVARDRAYRLFPDAAPVWVEVALRSNAYRMGWGEPPIPVFRWSVDAADEMRAIASLDEFDDHPPGLHPEDAEYFGLDDGADERGFGDRDHCVACGTAEQGRHDYCNACFYASHSCSACGEEDTVFPALVVDSESDGAELLVEPGTLQDRAQQNHPRHAESWQAEDHTDRPRLRDANLVLRCRNCGEVESSDFYAEEASEVYKSIFEELEPLLPIQV
ncbi:hypothetical protein [Haloglomus halophilum]|uniref:hypothetical protein n=1 Tax=Haloglomus halophilum TaxID=2962672 RepID=UPI0020C9D1AF|nr:hypothetical protein [Haloglomus halophilum]